PRRRTPGPRRPAPWRRPGRRGRPPARRWPRRSGPARRSDGRPGVRGPGRRGWKGPPSASPAPRTPREVWSAGRYSRLPLPTRTTPAPRSSGVRAPSKQLLLLGRVYLGVLGLELRDPAGGVQNALLAGVERVAGAAGLDADLAALGGAPGGEGAAAGADDLGGRVL